MVPIYIFGNDEDETLGQIIKKAISPFGTTVYNTDKHSDEINDTCSFFIHFFSLRTLVLKKFCICKNCKYSHSEI